MTRRSELPDRPERRRSWADDVVARLAAGFLPRDIRALARGEAVGRPDPRLRARIVSFWLHLRPAYYHAAATRFTHTFRLGLLAGYLFVVEVVTGVLLMVYYAPTPERAYADVLRIATEVPFGALVRDVHRLAADALVVVTVLHLVRTFLTASYKQPRRFTWVTGVPLLLAVLLVTFTGYVLPWDQLSYWAATVGTSVLEAVPPVTVGRALARLGLGGATLGADGLARFYLLHVLALPSVIVAVFAVHYYKVVRLGISLPADLEPPGVDTARRVPPSDRRYLLPDALVDEALVILAATCALLAAVVLGPYPGAPLGPQADPIATPTHIQAPWFFLWAQGLLKLGPPLWTGIVIPAALWTVLLLVPVLDRNPSRRRRDRRRAIGLFVAVSSALALLTWMGTPRFAVTLPAASQALEAVVPDGGDDGVHALGWDGLAVGEWDTRTVADAPAPPGIRRLMADYAERIAREHATEQARGGPGLPGGYGKLIVEPWQAGLAKVVARIVWQGPDGREQWLERTAFVHRAAGGHP